MYRTTIMLPEALKSRVVRESQALGISLGEFVRGALDAALTTPKADASGDPLLADTTSYSGRAPSDVSVRHDDYLYETQS